METKNFYETAARRSSDAGIRQLLGDLAEEERGHVDAADKMIDDGVSESDSVTARKALRPASRPAGPGLA